MTLKKILTQNSSGSQSIQDAAAMFVPIKESELLSKMTTNGLQVLYRYTRTPHLYSASMTSIQLTLKNLGQEALTDLKIGAKNLSSGMALHEFPGIASLDQGSTQTVTIGINFNDSTQTAKFDLVASGRVFTIQIQPQIGELVRGVSMPESLFDQEKLKLTGMNEVDDSFELPSALSDEAGIKKRIYEVANVVQVPSTLEASDIVIKFAGRTTATSSLVLITFSKCGTSAKLVVNCDKMVIGNMLVKEIKKAFE